LDLNLLNCNASGHSSATGSMQYSNTVVKIYLSLHTTNSSPLLYGKFVLVFLKRVFFLKNQKELLFFKHP